MSRPGGLTAMAIFNFVFSGLGALGLMGQMAAIAMMMSGNMPNNPNDDMPTVGLLITFVILGGISTILLLISGIGYLKQKSVLGRIVGSGYGVLGVTNGILQSILMRSDFGMLNLAFMIYPVLTVILLNSVFRKDFIN